MAEATLDLRGQPFGKWLVIHKGQQTAHGQFWVCQCACNPAVTVELVEAALVEGWARSCGCDYVNPRGRRCPRQNHVGQQLGKKLVLEYLPANHADGRRCPQYRCRCRCGRESLPKVTRLKSGMDSQCYSCSKEPALTYPRWYGEVFVEGLAGHREGTRERLYWCRYRDGSLHKCRKSQLFATTLRGEALHVNHGKVTAAAAEVLTWLAAGRSISAIARSLGVRRNSVYNFLRAHPEIQALLQTLPPDEELIDGVS